MVYNTFVKTSQQRLLEYIQTRQVVSAADLSLGLKMSPANARHHIRALLAQGLIETAGSRPQNEKGRPSQLYRVSAQKLGHNLDRLAAAALDEVRHLAGDEFYAASLSRIAASMLADVVADEHARRQTEAKTLTLRLGEAISRLNELHFEARWEAHRDAPRIVLGRCPYQKILPEHPELCQMDAGLLETLLNSPVKQTAKLAKDPRGNLFCVFQIAQKTSNKK